MIPAVLNFAHSQVSLGQVALELGIPARVPRETIQVRQRFLHDELSRRRSAGKILDRRLQFEQQRIGQLAHVLEAAVRQASLACRHHDAEEERDSYSGGGRDAYLVTADELRRAIAQRWRPRDHGQAFQVTADVLRQLFHRCVPPLRLLAQRHQNDVVEIATQVTAFGRFHLPDRDARFIRLDLADDVLHFDRTALLELEGMLSREQLVEDDSQGVDIARGGHGVPVELLRARVVERHRPHIRLCQHRLRRGLRVQELGDPEIQHLGRPVRGHEDVAGLQIAMHNEVLMRVLDGPAHDPEQLQALVAGQAATVAILVNRDPVDVLHHQVGQAPVGCAAVEEPNDVGMIERCQGLPLVPKPAYHVFAGQVRQHDFDCDSLTVLVVGSNGSIDGRHATLSHLMQYLVGAQPSSHQLLPVWLWRLMFVESFCALVRGEERLHLRTQGIIRAACVAKEGTPLAGV